MSSTSDDDSLRQLALQIRHNLQYQHRWTNLELHTKSPLTGKPLERPLLSGLPPRRMYVNPDEQVDLLRRETARKKQHKLATSSSTESTDAGDSSITSEIILQPELEWVFPSHLREEWTLRRFGVLFDSIGPTPSNTGSSSGAEEIFSKWRITKRALLATLQDDSTIVYYFIHDGIVKPRQN